MICLYLVAEHELKVGNKSAASLLRALSADAKVFDLDVAMGWFNGKYLESMLAFTNGVVWPDSHSLSNTIAEFDDARLLIQ